MANVLLLIADIFVLGTNNKFIFFSYLILGFSIFFIKRNYVLKGMYLLFCSSVVLFLIPPLHIVSYSFYDKYLLRTKKENIINLSSNYYLIFRAKGLLACGDEVALRSNGLIQYEYAIFGKDCLRRENISKIETNDSIVYKIDFVFNEDTTHIIVNLKEKNIKKVLNIAANGD